MCPGAADNSLSVIEIRSEISSRVIAGWDDRRGSIWIRSGLLRAHTSRRGGSGGAKKLTGK